MATFSNRFKATAGLTAGVIAVAALGANQVQLEKHVNQVAQQKQVVVKQLVVATPTLAPTATPAAKFKFVPKVSGSVK